MVKVTINFTRPSVDVPWTDRELLAPYIEEIRDIVEITNTISEDGLHRVEVTLIKDEDLPMWYEIREKHDEIRRIEHERRIGAGMTMEMEMDME